MKVKSPLAASLCCALLLLGGCAASMENAAEGRTGVLVSCPVSGEQVRVSDSAHMVEYRGEKYYFCCGGCRKEFEKNPEKYLGR